MNVLLMPVPPHVAAFGSDFVFWLLVAYCLIAIALVTLLWLVGTMIENYRG